MNFKSLGRSLICLAAGFGGVSCTNLYQHCFDMGAEYSGVEGVQGSTGYRMGGKTYVMGRRATFRRVECDPPMLIGKPLPDRFCKIDGTEQELLYREVTHDGKLVSYAENSSWKHLPIPAGTPCVLPGEFTPAPTIDGERQLNARALYAYPLGVVAGVLVDAPLNALAVGVAGPLMVCSTPLIVVSAQQQQLPPPIE